MHKIIAFPRSLLFLPIFFGGSVLLVLFAGLTLGINRKLFLAAVRGWSRYHALCARWIVGQRVVIEGHFSREPAFYVLKHESMFETIDLPRQLGAPMIFAKRELFDIPLWGPLAKAYGLLVVDREAGATALRQLRTDARAALAAGRPLCLFAEGTRVAPGETPPLKSGFAGLYSILKVPVIPVAVASGALNPRGGLLRYPGVIRFRIGEAIAPGLDRTEAEARVHAAINVLNYEGKQG